MDWQAHRRDAHRLGHMQENLKQIVYGGTDGIITTFAIVAGFTGAQAEGAAQIGGLAVLVFGLANLFADGVSMGLGEFLSLRSQHDLYRARRRSERQEMARNPQQEREELFEILRGRGLPAGEADTVTGLLMRHPRFMADLMMTYEFGLSDPEGDSPVLSALFTLIAFLGFGAIPLVPYLLLAPDARTLVLSVGATFLALVLLGLLRWNATGLAAHRAVAETLLVGTLSACVAFVVGRLVGG